MRDIVHGMQLLLVQISFHILAMVFRKGRLVVMQGNGAVMQRKHDLELEINQLWEH